MLVQDTQFTTTSRSMSTLCQAVCLSVRRFVPTLATPSCSLEMAGACRILPVEHLLPRNIRHSLQELRLDQYIGTYSRARWNRLQPHYSHYSSFHAANNACNTFICRLLHLAELRGAGGLQREALLELGIKNKLRNLSCEALELNLPCSRNCTSSEWRKQYLQRHPLL